MTLYRIDSPLESFELLLYLPFGGLDLSNSTLYMVVVMGLLSGFLYLNSFRPLLLPPAYQQVVETLYRFVLTMVKEQTHGAALPYFPLLLLLFLFILLSNLIGLLPFSFTTTAQLAVTFALALSANVGFLLLGFALHGFRFLQLFVPAGAPVVLLPLIVVIEVVSYLIRTFSLAIRLFANMMAGHTLLHILTTFSIKLSKLGLVGAVVGLLPFLLVGAVFVLEFGIAFIQAYVFVILLAIYANDSYHPVH
jgi:ATP synthase subunit 6